MSEQKNWIQRWKMGKLPSPGKAPEPRAMGPTEEIVALRKSPELLDRRNPGYVAAQARLTELYHQVYGDAVEEE